MPADVVVLGSANIDLGLHLDRLPSPGETVLTIDQRRGLGGKGVNQAVACHRAGCSTTLIAAVGDDPIGDEVVTNLAEIGLDVGLVRRAPRSATGTAHLMVDAAGENMIVVASGANATLTDLAAADAAAIRAARYLVLQCEVPTKVLAAGAAVAAAVGTRVILNAAPATSVPEDLLRHVDVLVVNEHEAQMLAGTEAVQQPTELAASLAGSVPLVIVTLGSRGSVWRGPAGDGRLVAPEIEALDSTGAGDTFVGYLAARLATGDDVASAVRIAGEAAALAVERKGAVDAIPTAEEVSARFSELLGDAVPSTAHRT
jgi:ribokinase